jgi:transposase
MSQRKRGKEFDRDFKVVAVRRMLAGESPTALAMELQVGRKVLYQWKDAYVAGGVEALRSRGRPRKGEELVRLPEPLTARGELLQSRQRIAELERKVGRQQLEIDFFVEALRRVKMAQEEETGQDATGSTGSYESKRRKAD